MIVCIPVTPNGQVDHGWGRANRLALADVSDGRIDSWQEIDVGWNALHDEGTEGAHHARVVRFLREHAVETVLTGGMGPGMRDTLGRMGITVSIGVTGDARAAAQASTA